MTDAQTDKVLKGKENAALVALDYVEDGMVLGLGSGSTSEIFIEALGARMAEGGLKVRGVASSVASARAADAAGIPLADVDQVERIHLAVDGADEVDPMCNLMKGGGGCLLREKIIADAADHFLVIVDESKMVDRLGAFPLPVEVDPFGFTVTARRVFEALRASGAKGWQVDLRQDDQNRPFKTDGGHYILDCQAIAIPEPLEVARHLRRAPGVIEHGLFVDMARTVIVGGQTPDDTEILER